MLGTYPQFVVYRSCSPQRIGPAKRAGKTGDPHASLGLRVVAESPPNALIQPYAYETFMIAICPKELALTCLAGKE